MLSLLWGWSLDGTRPDKFDTLGAVMCFGRRSYHDVRSPKLKPIPEFVQRWVVSFEAISYPGEEAVATILFPVPVPAGGRSASIGDTRHLDRRGKAYLKGSIRVSAYDPSCAQRKPSDGPQ